jgi:Family of unknown function (DUF6204)
VSGQHIVRVTVRGRFVDLSEQAREYLSSSLALHDVSNAEFSDEGTLTYDLRLDHFSFRFEIRTASASTDDRALQRGIIKAEEFLTVMGFGYRSLRVSATDMSRV